MEYVFESWYVRYEAAVAEVGLSVNGLKVLIVLHEEGSTTQTQLVQLMGIDKSTMVSIVDELEDSGFVERRRAKHDRRTVPIHVTAAGEVAAGKAAKVTDDSNSSVFAGFTDAERAEFTRYLSRLADAMTDAEDGSAPQE
jgi:MarR family transcriptional regulator, transcriptional regulator for hemolysin